MVDHQLELARLYDRQARGLRTLEDAAGVDTDLPPPVHKVGTVAHQPADVGNFTRPVDRRDRVVRCQLGQLDAATSKKGLGRDEKRIGSFVNKASKSCIDFRPRACIDNPDLQAHGARGRFHIFQRGSGTSGIGWIDKYGYANDCGHQLAQELQPLCPDLSYKNIETCEVTVGPS